MRQFLSAILGLFLTLTFSARAVENTWDYAVQVSASVQASPAKITLSWPQDTFITPASYTVSRKAPTDSSWGPGTTLSGNTLSYTDTNVAPGTAYEYRIVKVTGSYNGYGYIEAGIQAPLVDSRGKLILIVDNSVAGPLASELTRLQQDLAGDGWTVIRHDVARTDSVVNVKNLIKSDYNADPANVRSVFLFGHVPVPYSGQLNPDGHPDHIGAWPADVYYGDIDGNWTDNSVNFVENINTDPVDAARLTNLPGDGKFDQTQIPSTVELEVGRVDLANMPGRTTWGGPATFPSETELLRKYLNKDHNFRQHILTTQRRAIVGDYFGVRGGESFAASGYRSFAPIVGANNIRNLNTEFNDQQGVWVPQLAKNDYLLAYGCGAGAYTAISGLGNSGLYNGANTPEFVQQNIRGIFNLIFGSWLGDWDHEDDILRAPLATDYGLVSVWSGRPHWFIHPMALGDTIGSVTRLTQNNNGLYQTQINSAQNRIHIALMGDPTLRLHPVAPVTNLTGTAGGNVTLAWNASSDSNLVGYHVYRASSANGPFTRLTGSPIAATSYTDSGANSGATYMVRAVKLESSASGTYYNASQGAFYTVGGSNNNSGGSTTTPPATADTTAPTVSIAAPAANATISGASVSVSANASDNVGVAGVQFKLDGANLNSEVTAAPFSTTFNTTSLANGNHTLGAVARDAAGNIASANTLTVSVNNATSTGGSSTGATSGDSAASSPGSISPTGETIWFDDALPPNAGGVGGNGDTWNWVTSNPTPISGSKAHQSAAMSGEHSHWFGWSSQNLPVATGDKLFVYVYLDPANVPSELMLAWSTNSSWEHRAYWGANKLGSGTNGTASRYYVGPLPAAGQWVRLEVPASAVGLENETVTAMNFMLVDGRVTFDKTGKFNGNVAATTDNSGSSPVVTQPITEPSTGTVDTVWFDDALPPNAGGVGGNGDTWNWVTSNPTPISGSKAHQSAAMSGEHSHWFGWSSQNLPIAAGEKLFTYVYLDPANPPSEVMLAWSTNSSWEHRAYWGANTLGSGTNGTASRYYAGPLPAAGQWVRLEVPASAVGLEGQTATAMNFMLVDGRATFDKTGKFTGTSSSTTTPPPSSGSDTGSAPSTGGSTTDSGGGLVVTPPTNTSGSGSTTTPSNDVVWFDDALPRGSTGGATGGDAWVWVTSNPTPYSGIVSHQSNISNGPHEHFFGLASQTMPVAKGDKLFVYVYLDPAHVPQELMLTWGAATWDHRAYWGANKINNGADGSAGRHYMGPLPAAGQWVRLEVPASAVALEGQNVNGMGFALFGGRAAWDNVGKTAASSTSDSSGGSSSGDTGSNNSGSTGGTTVQPISSNDTVWIDDALPPGAGDVLANNGDAWNWITGSPTPFSGTKAHKSANAAGQHEHWFGWSSQNLPIASGDKLFTYVYIDPATKPTEIMLSWSTNSSWDHRAYWGADKIGRGTANTVSRYHAGALPATGGWVRLEVPASAVGLEDQTITAMMFSLYDGSATWDASGKSSASTSGSGSGNSGGSSSNDGSGTSSGDTGSNSGGTAGGGSTTPPDSGSSGGTTTPPSDGGSTGTPITSVAENYVTRIPQVGDYQLRVINPTTLELYRITTKQPDPATVTDWNFVNNGTFNAPATSKFVVTSDGRTLSVSSVGFKRRVAYAPALVRDLRIENCLYLTLASPVSDNQTVQVKNPDGSLWPSSMDFVVKADPLRYSPAIHVNQEGYTTTLAKKAMIGYYLGNKGELAVDASAGFKLVNASTGATAFTGTLKPRKEVGYEISPMPYQNVLEADFTSFQTPGEYQLVVPGLGASLPFVIDNGIAMNFARTYALGLYHQRSGMANALPYTRFTHAADHTAPAEIPTADPSYANTWKFIASYSSGNKTQTAPVLNGPSTMLFPFVNQGKVDVSGGHFDAGDYSKYTLDVAMLVHLLMFTADSIQGASSLDNLGLPESGDGISDIMQEAKWEADYLAKLQDADGGFYFIVYPKNREYEGDVQPEFGDQQVVWPKNTSATAAAVAALAQCASSPQFKKAYPDVAASYLAKAKAGWQFLMNAQAKYGKAGAYQRVTFYGDNWNDNDELAWAACEMFLATGDTQYQAKLKEWFPNPADPNTFHDSYVRVAECYGNAIRSYAFAARSGRLPASALDAGYLAACENQIKLAGQDALNWSTESAYGTDLSDPAKHYMMLGWYFSMDWASAMATAYQIDPQPAYIDALVGNENYEAGSNPVNVSFVAGLGVRRQHEFVSQYANTDERVLPPTGLITGNVVNAFSWVGTYGNERTTLSFPADDNNASSTPLNDRWSDTWNTTNELITVNLGRAMLGAAAVAVQTSAKSTPWKPTATAQIVVPSSARVGSPVTLSLGSGVDLTNARITWEAKGQQPDFGSTFTITPKTSGAQWVEVEITWPDGRRMFGKASLNAQ